ncbi:hypothetical protein D4R99_04025 [bacterium]|nr:MAG: hypothetical protein D4R99_04025 [bacterium]
MILGVVLGVSLLLAGCAAVPMYDSYGNYRGSQLTVDAGRMADMGTGAIIGGLAGVAMGDPISGAALGAGMSGMAHGYNYYSPPIYQHYYYPPPVHYYQRFSNTYRDYQEFLRQSEFERQQIVREQNIERQQNIRQQNVERQQYLRAQEPLRIIIIRQREIIREDHKTIIRRSPL